MIVTFHIDILYIFTLIRNILDYSSRIIKGFVFLIIKILLGD